MKKFIVTTTIYKPSKATLAFEQIAQKQGWEFVIVGDMKTPHELYRKGKHSWTYLSPTDQLEMNMDLSDAIGWNCIQRRNFGFLYAYMHGADIVASVDDDNVPMHNWGRIKIGHGMLQAEEFKPENNLVFDPLSVPAKTNHCRRYPFWHRGYPIQLADKRGVIAQGIEQRRFDIQANLWCGNPDVDAIHNIAGVESITTSDDCSYFSANLAPFNSQNTLLLRDVLPHYFVMPHVGRVDDIWAAYYVQSMGFKVVFCEANVIQERNEHDLLKDLKAEMFGYENTFELVQNLHHFGSTAYMHSLPEPAAKAFELYKKAYEQ